jgi:ATP-dependent helicase/DNAse subunit B
MSDFDIADMKNLHYHAFNYRNAHSTEASKAFDILEDFVSRYGISAGERWREEWSEVCNENQILHNLVVELTADLKAAQEPKQ